MNSGALHMGLKIAVYSYMYPHLALTPTAGYIQHALSVHNLCT